MRVSLIMSAAVAGMAAAPALALAALPRTNDALTYQRREAGWSPAWFICDGIDRPVVQVVGAPDAQRGVTVWTYRKTDFRTGRATYLVGRDDPGMSQVSTTLLAYPAGKREVGGFSSFSPAALPDPAAATTGTFTSLRIGDADTRCRWLPNTRVQLFTPKRSVTITREGGGYVYRSFDYAAPARISADGHSTTPSLTLRGGRQISGTRGGAAGAAVYLFANGRYGYRVTVSNDPGRPGAALGVTRDGRTLSTETAAGYTAARR